MTSIPSFSGDPDQAITQLFGWLREAGGASYFGEPVTQLEHQLQTAALATDAGAEPALVAAALLHDVGHLAHDHGEDAADRGVDTAHERLGAELLAAVGFGPEVTAPVAGHVAAKRYLAAIRPRYMSGLSAASLQSLGLQGGAFSVDEAVAFLDQPGAHDAVALRGWDDQAKEPGLEVPDLEAYRPLLRSLLSR